MNGHGSRWFWVEMCDVPQARFVLNPSNHHMPHYKGIRKQTCIQVRISLMW